MYMYNNMNNELATKGRVWGYGEHTLSVSVTHMPEQSCAQGFQQYTSTYSSHYSSHIGGYPRYPQH